MEGTTTFGYEQDNGKIQYIIVRYLILDEIEKYLAIRETPTKYNISNESNCILDYFSDTKYNDEESIWRILYMLDGTIRCRKRGSPGEFLYKLK